MILYHGSNIEVRVPRLLHSRKRGDFGPAFYLTTDLTQAKNWARIKHRRQLEGAPCVSVFEADEKQFSAMNVLHFGSPDSPWLQYIVENRRKARGLGPDGFDIVSGPVADDQTSDVLTVYIQNLISEVDAIRQLLPMKLKDQYAFKTERALNLLRFREVIKL